MTNWGLAARCTLNAVRRGNDSGAKGFENVGPMLLKTDRHNVVDESTEANGVLTSGLQDIEGELHLALASTTEAQHAAPFIEVARYAIGAGGHRWRPLTILRIHELLGDGCAAKRPQLLKLGAAIELLHTASVLLDDSQFMDDATLRRGQKCAHLVFGGIRALEGALWLADLSASIVAHIDILNPGADLSRRFHQVKTSMLYGQLVDLEDTAVDELALVEKGRLKSGVLYGFCCEGTALICDRSDVAVPLRTFGELMGTAYQISDDIHDVNGSADVTGKFTDQDVDKHTAPRTLGLERASELRDIYVAKARDAAGHSGLDQCVLIRLVETICAY
jgi:geranylgeranyl pyrophosphate synthase